jgi:hypothetical protein
MHEHLQSAVEDDSNDADVTSTWDQEDDQIKRSELEGEVKISGHFELNGDFKGLIKGYVCFRKNQIPVKVSGRIELGNTYAYVNGSASICTIYGGSHKWKDNHPNFLRELPRPPPWYIASYADPEKIDWFNVYKAEWSEYSVSDHTYSEAYDAE